MVRYGLKQDIKIDLTLLDDMNDFKNIIEGVLIKERFLYQGPSNGQILTDRDHRKSFAYNLILKTITRISKKFVQLQMLIWFLLLKLR